MTKQEQLPASKRQITGVPADTRGTAETGIAASNSPERLSPSADLRFMSQAVLGGPNRPSGPTPLEKVWLELGKVSELLKSLSDPDVLPTNLGEIKKWLAPVANLGDILDAARECLKYISEEPLNHGTAPQYVRNISEATENLFIIADAISQDSEYLLGFKRDEISTNAIRQLSRYISFLSATLEHGGDLPHLPHLKRDEQPTADGATASQIIKSLLSNGIIDRSFAKYLTSITLGCDGNPSSPPIHKPPCIVWHSNEPEIGPTKRSFPEADYNYKLSKQVAEETTSLYGHHCALAVSLERESETLAQHGPHFPYSVPCKELERRLHQSAIIVTHIPQMKLGHLHTLREQDPILFRRLDMPRGSAAVWMCLLMPSDHIHKIIVPDEMRPHLDKNLPAELRRKIIYTDGTDQINTSEIDNTRTGATIKCPRFKEALELCLRGLEREAILAEIEREAILAKKSLPTRVLGRILGSTIKLLRTDSWIGAKLLKLDALLMGAKPVASLRVGIHATRLGK